MVLAVLVSEIESQLDVKRLVSSDWPLTKSHEKESAEKLVSEIHKVLLAVEELR